MPRFPLSEAERRDLAAYLLGDRAPSQPVTTGPDRALIDEGRRYFSSLGCARCHEAGRDTTAPADGLNATPLNRLAPSGGCLNGSGKAPRYRLDAFQQRALRAAIQGLADRPELSPAQRAHRRMVALNCYACHQRDGRGGPDEERLKYFTSSESDLGDEGRLPPLLTGAGRKLKVDAMRRIIQGQAPARPYMVTRMPDFGPEHATYLAEAFAAADHDPNEKPTARDGEEFKVGRNMWGRHLLGVTGLSCITCHPLNGHRSLGIQAMDLAHAPKRLRPEWFRDYLIDPAKFRPGTRMPSFWPEGKPMLKGNGGTTERQIDSIWVYLTELDQSRLPVGLVNTNDLLLKPTDRPIVFRTFMEQAGMRAIAVGYPAGTHAAFDARYPRWVIAWTGRFLNAEATWDDRFTPLTRPEGDHVIPIQPLQPVHGQNAIGRFLGYQLHLRAGHPIFLYRVGASEFSDVLLPDAGGGRRMSRTLSRRSGGAPEWIEVANGKNIAQSGSKWRVDDQLTVTTAAPVRAVTTADGRHLQVRVKEQATVIYEW